MREIKFRAWVKEDKKMVSVISLHDSFYLPFCVYSTSQSSDGITELDYDKCEIMQFTGLKDKNKKEIFEGDIIKDEALGFFGKVIFRDCCFWNENIITKKVNPMIVNRFEVIGNKFENPELLEGGKN